MTRRSRWNWLYRYDPQLVLVFDPQISRWVLYRQGERFGRPPRDLAWYEVSPRVRHGSLFRIRVLETPLGQYREPGLWLLDMLRASDTRRSGFRYDVMSMDAHNERLKARYEEEGRERVRNRISEDFPRIRDELRGDPGHRHVFPVS